MTDKDSTGDLWVGWTPAKRALEPTGEALRDAGVKLVAEHNETWLETAMAELGRFLRVPSERPDFTSDTFRGWAAFYGLPEPKHSNAWGSLMAHAARRGMIVDTGMQRKATRPSAHARRLPVWRKA